MGKDGLRELLDQYRRYLEERVERGEISKTSRKIYLSAARKLVEKYCPSASTLEEAYTRARKDDRSLYNARGFVEFAKAKEGKDRLREIFFQFKRELATEGDYSVLLGKVCVFDFGDRKVKGEVVKADLENGFFWVRDLKTDRTVLIPASAPKKVEVYP